MRSSTIVILAAAFALSACAGSDRASRNPNPGPCPSALSLYDAHRIVEMHGDIAFENVGFTGEILNVRSLCRYYDARPIIANMEIDFAFGRGPAARSEEHVYTYFVAVTRRDTAVIHREDFPIRVRFPRGEDRVYVRETLGEIVIPRANADVSGQNFEIIVGFDLTEAQLEFNRSGQRFLIDAGRPRD